MSKTSDTSKVIPTNPAIAPNSQVEVTIAWDTVKVAYDKVVKAAAKNVHADGFRPGKVPPQVAEKLLDQEKLYNQVLSDVLPAAYTDALKKANKIPFSQPEIDPLQMEKGKDWKFVLYFAEKPDVKLGKYQDVIKNARKTAEVEIKKTDEARTKAAQAATAVKTSTADNQKKADPKFSTPSAPAPQPPLTDQQKDDVRTRHIFKNLVEAIQPKVPELLVRQEANRDLERLAAQLRQFQLPVEQYLKSRNQSAEDLQQEFSAIALSSLQIEFIMAEVAKQEKITITDAEIDKTLEEMGDKVRPELRKDSEYRSYVFSTLLKQKVVKHFLSLA